MIDNMTDEFEDEAPADTSLMKHIVHLKSDGGIFEADALAIYALPGMKVLDAMIAPEREKMIKMIELFHLSINDPTKIEDLELLSFRELNGVVGEWIIKSHELEAELDHEAQTGKAEE